MSNPLRIYCALHLGGELAYNLWRCWAMHLPPTAMCPCAPFAAYTRSISTVGDNPEPCLAHGREQVLVSQSNGGQETPAKNSPGPFRLPLCVLQKEHVHDSRFCVFSL
jgi:hypothetical protein